MPIDEELLDFEVPITLPFYEKVIDYLEAMSNFSKTVGIFIFSLLAALIIYFKANSSDSFLLDTITTTSGIFILMIGIGFLVLMLLQLICTIINYLKQYTPKIGKLELLSISFSLSVLTFLALCVLAIFVD